MGKIEKGKQKTSRHMHINGEKTKLEVAVNQANIPQNSNVQAPQT